MIDIIFAVQIYILRYIYFTKRGMLNKGTLKQSRTTILVGLRSPILTKCRNNHPNLKVRRGTYLFMLEAYNISRAYNKEESEQNSHFPQISHLILQLPLLGSCCILKLSRDKPKFPSNEFPKSFNFPSASSFSFVIFSSCNFSKRLLGQCQE